MDLLKKVKAALKRHFKLEVVDLEDDDGIYGVIVSDRFYGVESIDRQTLIQKALLKSANPLSKEEWRRILIIAPMTPAEYLAYAPPHKTQKAHKA